MTRKLPLPIFLFLYLAVTTYLSFILDSKIISPQDNQSRDPLYRLLGSFKEVLGDTAFLKADSYFHGGVDMDIVGSCKNDADHTLASAHAQESHHDHKEEHSHEHEKDESFGIKSSDWISGINNKIKIVEDRHLDEESVQEILPFLKMAVELDPYNVTAVVTTAYWINDHFKQPDEAIKILTKATKDNPEAWDVFYHLGKLYLISKKDYFHAASWLQKASEKLTDTNSENFEKRICYYYLAMAYEGAGQKDKALPAYTKALSYFKSDEVVSLKKIIHEKISKLSL